MLLVCLAPVHPLCSLYKTRLSAGFAKKIGNLCTKAEKELNKPKNYDGEVFTTTHAGGG
jgi:hypothetical protein